MCKHCAAAQGFALADANRRHSPSAMLLSLNSRSVVTESYQDLSLRVSLMSAQINYFKCKVIIRNSVNQNDFKKHIVLKISKTRALGLIWQRDSKYAINTLAHLNIPIRPNGDTRNTRPIDRRQTTSALERKWRARESISRLCASERQTEKSESPAGRRLAWNAAARRLSAEKLTIIQRNEATWLPDGRELD